MCLEIKQLFLAFSSDFRGVHKSFFQVQVKSQVFVGQAQVSGQESKPSFNTLSPTLNQIQSLTLELYNPSS